MSESTQDRPAEADEKAPKPGEQDTETVAGQPRKAPDSKQQPKQEKDAKGDCRRPGYGFEHRRPRGRSG